jgi:hypothetical protein
MPENKTLFELRKEAAEDMIRRMSEVVYMFQGNKNDIYDDAASGKLDKPDWPKE